MALRRVTCLWRVAQASVLAATPAALSREAAGHTYWIDAILTSCPPHIAQWPDQLSRGYSKKRPRTKQRQATSTGKPSSKISSSGTSGSSVANSNSNASSREPKRSRSINATAPLDFRAAPKAVAPPLGRVPPTSAAAAAAAASHLYSLKQDIPPPLDHPSASDLPSTETLPPPAAAAVAAAGRSPIPPPPPSSQPPLKPTTSSSTTAQNQAKSSLSAPAAESQDTSSSPSQNPLPPTPLPPPWALIQTLLCSSPFPTHLIANCTIPTYISYLHAARHGMPSIYNLGVVRQHGYEARGQLLLRELLLKALLQLFPECGQSDEAFVELTKDQLQQVVESIPRRGLTVANLEDTLFDYIVVKRCCDLLHHQAELRRQWQQQPDSYHSQYTQPPAHEAVQAAATAAAQAGIGEYAGGRTTHQQHLYATAPAATAGSPAATAGGGRGGGTLAASKEGIAAAAAAAAGQQQEQEQLAKEVSATLFMPIWDAFFDATLDDYLEYLQAAAAGAPSVFMPRGLDPSLLAVEGGAEAGEGGGEVVADQRVQQQQQQLQGNQQQERDWERQQQQGSRENVEQQQQQHRYGAAAPVESKNEMEYEEDVLPSEAQESNPYIDCLHRLAIAIRVLSSLTIEQRRKPLLLIGMEDVPLIAAAALVEPEDVLGVLGDFYMFKRLGMYLAMDALQQG